MKTFLVKCRVVKDGKSYWDIWLCWRIENKLISVRVSPTFTRDYRFLAAHALEIDSIDNIEKYV